ncbi:2-hydroxy-3-oxopropionate reductase [Paraburkholderia xenovorans LB400]|uniref:2-hydroxy-3-oxopropionate reductase n=1 Tax=Paraburkholderia xenovorans (strain LB400) TaxID=266265 RepID=Q13GF7_PARXL|nr:2-hydroxy-3-oxopropionate reductase [Paraburkholderia xenovorans]ABE36832.1 2-hydroxy-3-oxopropionate reductase [Paraburkholderia xenovorans LB400]AIP34804.1 2-hydroxy-3-oxopropionate reductase [Paraburkholderia xenovorans LB400]
MASNELKVGFIGLGIMGSPMAAHLLAAGHRLFVNTRSKVPDAIAQGDTVICATPAAVAGQADVVFLMLPDTPDVEQVLFGTEGVATGLGDHGGATRKLVVDCSSIDPLATRTFAERIGKVGGDYLDAPVSGGEVGAKAASLTIMVGGAEESFERIKPLLLLMGKNVTRVGGVGDGQICKVANQIIVASNIVAVSEALVFASRAGADPGRIRQALMGGFAASRVLEVHGERMIKRTFQPGFRIRLHQKDLNIALQSARTLSLALPQAANAAQLMQTAAALGHAESDHAALVRAIECLAQHEIELDE